MDQLFYYAQEIIWHMKVKSFFSPYAKCSWQPTSSKKDTGTLLPNTRVFSNGVLEIVSPYPENKTTKHMLPSLSFPSSFSYSDHEWQQEGP